MSGKDDAGSPSGAAVAKAREELFNSRPRFHIKCGIAGPPTWAPSITIEITGGDPDALDAFGAELSRMVLDRFPTLKAGST